jgi:hypothetical protein
VEKGHRPGEHSAPSRGKPAPLHQVVTFAQLRQEFRDLAKVVAVVGVPHDDVLAARGGDAAHERAPVTTLGDADDTRAMRSGNLLRTVCAPVVR